MRFKPQFVSSLKISLLSLILTGIGATSAAAISPSLVEYRDKVNWSRVQFSTSGTCVHDRHNPEGNHITSSWCEDGIFITYKRIWQEQTGTRTVTKYREVDQQVPDEYVCESRNRCRWKYKTVRQQIPYTDIEPVYVERSEIIPIQSIEFNLRGEVIKYEGGELSEALKEFLTSLPASNQRVTLILENGQSIRYEVGKKTVAEWRKVYQVNPRRSISNSEGSR
jgi:hypothetical protein